LKRYITIIACLILSLALSFQSMSETSQESQRLEDLKKSRDEVKQEKKSVQAKKKSIRAELEDIEKQLTARRKELRMYERNLGRCERDIEQLKAALNEVELRSKQTQALMINRLRAMYKFGYEGGQLSYLKLLVGADSISDLLNKYKYMSAIAIADKNLLDKIVAEKAEIKDKKEQVEARKKRIIGYRSGAERVRKLVEKKKQSRQNTLVRLQKSEEYLTRTLNELEESVRELEILIARLREKSNAGSDGEISNLGEQRGKLAWPASGTVIKNAASSMKGVTIKAVYGTDIRCVGSGTVEYAQWFDGVGFGQMVIINHGYGYRTLYSHASELLVRAGERVNKGQVIARVGDTGSLRGSILYFEIWQGTKVMPTRQWMRKK